MSGQLSDFHYGQVLNNLAMFAYNPHALPSHLQLIGGSVEVSDRVAPGFRLSWPPDLGATRDVYVDSSRLLLERWDISPETSPDALRRLQELYQWAVSEHAPPGLKGRVVNPPATQPTHRPSPGWLKHGRPTADALYVGRYRGHTVYVTRDGAEGLTKFTLLVMGESPKVTTLILPTGGTSRSR